MRETLILGGFNFYPFDSLTIHPEYVRDWFDASINYMMRTCIYPLHSSVLCFSLCVMSIYMVVGGLLYLVAMIGETLMRGVPG